MLRITGGRRRGTVLASPPGHGTRPATARVRQWIFDVLGPPVGDEVLDLFAGTGAVGLEAMSRGARRALFVENADPALACLERNIARTGFQNDTEIWRVDAEQAVLRLRNEGRRFSLCFCDPPYAYERLRTLVEESLLELIAPGGTLVVEHRGTEHLDPPGLTPFRETAFGDTVLTIWAGPDTVEEE